MIRPCLSLKFSQFFLISFSHHINLRYAHEFMLSRCILNALQLTTNWSVAQRDHLNLSTTMFFFSVISDKFARGYLDLCIVDFTPHLNPVAETLQGRCSDATLIEVRFRRYRTPIGQQVCFQFIERRLCCTVCSLCSRHLGRFEVSAHWSIERNPWGPTSGCWPQHFPGTAGSLIKGWGRLWNAGSE